MVRGISADLFMYNHSVQVSIATKLLVNMKPVLLMIEALSASHLHWSTNTLSKSLFNAILHWEDS